MNKTILLLLFVVTSIMYSQKAIITGNVMDSKTALPISGAVFIVEATPVRIVTNENGEFFIDEKVPLGEFTASITKEGYVTRRFTLITKKGNKAALYNIRLQTSGKKRKEKSVVSSSIDPETIITGTIRDKKTAEVIPDARVRLLKTTLKQTTDINGNFLFEDTVPDGSFTLQVSKNGYVTTNHEVLIVAGKIGTVTGITLAKKIAGQEGFTINSYALDELYAENTVVKNTAGLYQNATTPFLRTAAYQFSPSFFQLRGQDGSAGKVLINGIEINNVADGSPEWNTIAGLEEARQNENYTSGLGASDYAFGGQNGVLNINTMASDYSKGGKIGYVSTNRRFTHGVNASYATGLMENGWAFMVSASKRFADQGYYEGTSYDVNSFFVSIEKKLNANHVLGVTGIFTPTKRNAYAANTEEVFQLKGTTYNPLWGTKNGEVENYNTQNSTAPIALLTYLWTPSSHLKLQTSVSFSSGKFVNGNLDALGSDIDANEAVVRTPSFDPDPTSVAKLPSFFLSDLENPDPIAAQNARDTFVTNGQLDWSILLAANSDPQAVNASYILYDDVKDHLKIDFNTLLEIKLSEYTKINGTLGYSYTNTDNYAQVSDLLGSKGYLDISPFDGSGLLIQSDIDFPNRVVRENDTFRYNYAIETWRVKGFSQLNYNKETLKTHVGIFASYGSNLRNGLFRNGSSLLTSFGVQESTVVDYGVKGGLHYQFTEGQSIFVNGRFASEAPALNDYFYDAREHSNLLDPLRNSLIPDVSQNTIGAELGYTYENPVFSAQLTGYYTSIANGREATLFKGNTIGTDNSTFIKEVLVGVQKRFAGLEIGLNYKVLSQLTAGLVGALGDYQYTNDPRAIYVLSEIEAIDLGEAALKGTHVAAGPEIALSARLEYQNTKNWWIAANANYFDNSYIAVNAYNRTRAFREDVDGTIFSNFTEQNAAGLLAQRKVAGYFLANLSGGKFWKINKNILGVKLNIHNILGTEYRLGGYERQGALDYNVLLTDSARAQPLFGDKVWAGYGLTYFANVYYRF